MRTTQKVTMPANKLIQKTRGSFYIFAGEKRGYKLWASNKNE